MKVNFVLFQDSKALKHLNTNGKGLSNDVDSDFVHTFSVKIQASDIGHFNIPRPAVTFKQVLNCTFLFMIYAPQSPTLLPKLRLM